MSLPASATSGPKPGEPSQIALDLRRKLAALSPPPINPDRLPARRRVMQVAYEPRVQRALAAHAPVVTRVSIGEVPCLEIVSPRGAATGTILYCFGGGHIGGEARQDLPITAPLAAWTGARIVAPNYRLAPEHPYPAAVDDVMSVYRALVAATDGPIALVGESAGGNLVLALILRLLDAGLPRPECAVLMSPWCDLRPQGDPADPEIAGDPTLTTDFLNVAATLYAGETPRDTPGVSPVLAPFDPRFPATLITTGTHDRLRAQSEDLAHAMAAAGVAVDLTCWPGLWHVFEFYDELPEAEASLRQIAGVLRRRLAGGGN